ncbi:DNA cytosine methyltransferase [Paenibacillus sp. Y412MC10]|uniref:DNA cytosine methyltransferase n=1 Tax=Geobacillus sp. (strain Y412MC10) TaxID=481743 RepID=UPI0011AB862C|nr:DNA cytosine methyltransferase [Paenibacillus sp. Y412MC10]
MRENDIRMVRNLRTSEKDGHTRLIFEPSVLEEANFSISDRVHIRIEQSSIIVMKTEDEEADGIISRRMRSGWSAPRPFFDRANREISKVLRARERIDIIIKDGEIIVTQEQQTYDVFYIAEETQLRGDGLSKIRLFSLPSGSGMATSGLVHGTGLYDSVGGLDMDPFAIDTFRANFTSGVTIWGDMRFISPEWINPSDVCWLSPDCTEYSPIGARKIGSTSGLGAHYARLVWATGAQALIIEQVPQYYSTRSYHQLRSLLTAAGFLHWHEAKFNSYDFGAVCSRPRGFAVATKEATDFRWPEVPNIPERFRPTVGQIVGQNWEDGDWIRIEGSPVEKILKKDSGGSNNFKSTYTLVDQSSTRMNAILSSYRRTNVTSSYLQHPDGKWYRFFSSDELLRFMNIPEEFFFPDHISETQRTQLVGQGVCGLIARAIGTELAVALMGSKIRNKRRNRAEEESPAMLVSQSGQLELII